VLANTAAWDRLNFVPFSMMHPCNKVLHYYAS
jgi:hypothetical protein